MYVFIYIKGIFKYLVCVSFCGWFYGNNLSEIVYNLIEEIDY